MKFTNSFSKFTHPFLHSYWNFTFSFQSIIYIEIYAVLLLAKSVPIYTFLVCKVFGTKIRSCKIFDKFQVCFIWDFMGILNLRSKKTSSTPGHFYFLLSSVLDKLKKNIHLNFHFLKSIVWRTKQVMKTSMFTFTFILNCVYVKNQPACKNAQVYSNFLRITKSSMVYFLYV